MSKLVLIAHPVAGNVKSNIEKILALCKEIHTIEIIPYVPYIAALHYLDDAIPEERALGMAVTKECFRRRSFDELWLCGPRISSGMKEEIRLSLKYGVFVKCHNPALLPEFKKVIEEINTGTTYD